MVRRVYAADGQAVARLDQKGPQQAEHRVVGIQLRDGRRRAHVVNHETGIGRGIEVRRKQIDEAFRALAALQVTGGQPDAIHQFVIVVVLRAGMNQRRRHQFDETARHPGGVLQIFVWNAAEPWTRFRDLRSEIRVDGRVSAGDDVNRRIGRAGWGRHCGSGGR